MYNLRPRNKSDNTYKYYLGEDEDSFTPKKNRKKTKNKTKPKTKNKRNNKKSLNIKPEKTKITKNKKSNEFYPLVSYISEIQNQIDYPKVKTKAYQENKSKEKFTIPQNKKYNKRKKESNGNFRKEYEIKEEKFINIKKEEELKEYYYIKDIDDNTKRYNTIHVYQNDKITKGKTKKEQNKKSTKRGNTKIYEKTKESIPKKKNSIKRNSKIDKSLNKSFDYDKIYNKYKCKNYSSYDLRKPEKKRNINNDRTNNNNYKYGSSYNKHKFKVILDESEEEEDIIDLDEKPKTTNKKNIKILEKEKNNKYKKDKNQHNQKGKNKVEKVIKTKTKIKKEEKNRNSIRIINNNIIDIDKSFLDKSFDFNQYQLPQKYSNQNNLINNKKTSEKCTLKTKYTEFHKKLFKYNDDDLEKYRFSSCQIDDELFTVTLNRFPRSNDIVIKIKNEENEEDEDNNINLLGNKRKRNIKKEKIEDKKSKKKVKKRNNKENKKKEEKTKKENQPDKEIQKTKNKKNKKNKSIKNENKKTKNQKTSNIKVTQFKKEEYYEDDYDYDSEYDFSDDFINNNNINIKSKSKRGTKKHSSMKKKEKEKVNNLDIQEENEKENHEDDYMISSCSSLSDEDKNMKKLYYNDSKNNIKNDDNKNNNIIVIKSDEITEDPENENYQKMEREDLTVFSLYKNIIDGDIENKEIKEKNISYDNCNDITIDKNNISGFSNKQYSYSSFENSFDYSFPIEYEDKIQIKEDVTYFGKNTRYIKYNPIDEYVTPIPIKDKKNFKNKISKPKYINFLNKSKKDYNTIDSDFTDITSSNNNNNGNDNDLPAILCIPRIKPFKDEHSKKIINKLKNCRIPQHKILDEKVKKEEQKLYIGSFILYDENTNIKVSVPCYRENEIMKEFMRRKNLRIIEFQEDNDIDTDEEQLQLEVERNNEALINFMKKVENDREYVENHLTRKKRE